MNGQVYIYNSCISSITFLYSHYTIWLGLFVNPPFLENSVTKTFVKTREFQIVGYLQRFQNVRSFFRRP